MPNWRVLLVLSLFMLPGNSLSALEPQLYDTIGKRLGLTANQLFLLKNQQRTPKTKKDLPIIGHYRSQSNVLLTDEDQNIGKKTHREIEEIKPEDLEIQEPELKNAPEIPSCLHNRRREVYKIKTQKSNASAIFDLLALGVNPPEDAASYFGSDVYVFKYTSDIPDELSNFVSARGIKCLPSRLRLRDGVLIIYEGDEALKTFEHSRKGKVHKEIKDDLRSLK